MKRSAILALAALLTCTPLAAFADSVTVTMNRLLPDGKIGEVIGTVLFEDSPAGLVIKPNLTGLTPGKHRHNFICQE